ncbi:MAG TPA: PAS domain-containing protein [Terriglobia bacterium]|nr:PAS domain-containing protein [Terriglobia bacterium]
MTQMAPKIGELYAYWLGLAQAGIPERAAFDPDAVKSLLPNMMMVEIEDEPFRIRFRLSGSKVDEVTGVSITGRYLDELAIEQGAAQFAQLHALYAACQRQGRHYIGALDWPNRQGQTTRVSLGIFPLKVDGMIRQLVVIEDYDEITEDNAPLQWYVPDIV